MTIEEARKIARVAGTADGGCSTCVGNLVEELRLVFPEFTWAVGDDAPVEYLDANGIDVGADGDWDRMVSRVEVTVTEIKEH